MARGPASVRSMIPLVRIASRPVRASRSMSRSPAFESAPISVKIASRASPVRTCPGLTRAATWPTNSRKSSSPAWESPGVRSPPGAESREGIPGIGPCRAETAEPPGAERPEKGTAAPSLAPSAGRSLLRRAGAASAAAAAFRRIVAPGAGARDAASEAMGPEGSAIGAEPESEGAKPAGAKPERKDPRPETTVNRVGAEEPGKVDAPERTGAERTTCAKRR